MRTRNSQIEMLRIVAMLMIVAHHYTLYGVFQNYLDDVPKITGGDNLLFANFLLPGGIVGVAIFFIIAGYFGIQNDKVRIKDTVFKTVSYSWLCLVVWLLLLLLNVIPSQIRLSNITNSIFPCASSMFWFVTIYILIMLCKPVINTFLRKQSDERLVGLLLLLLFIYACLRATAGSLLGLYQGMVYYVTGVVLYRLQDKLKNIKNVVFILLGVIGWSGYVIFDGMEFRASSLVSVVIMGTISAVGFSALFIYAKEFGNVVINKISGSTLAVYLIHENPLFREILWSKILHVESFQWESKFFPLWASLSIIAIFAACVIIDIAKKKTIDKAAYGLGDWIRNRRRAA